MFSQVINTTPVEELMNTDVISIAPGFTMDRVKDIFEKNTFHHLPVTDADDKLVGMISRLDYNRVLSCYMLFNEKKNEEYNLVTLKSLLVSDIMISPVASIGPDDSIHKAATMFKENQFHALPVVDENKKLKGIITTFDLLIFAYK